MEPACVVDAPPIPSPSSLSCDAQAQSAVTSAGKKRVRWATITIHEFGVDYGGSAVPKNGPSIGLSKTPEFTWSTRVGTMARSKDGVRRFSASERIALLQQAGYALESIKSFAQEAASVRQSRELYHSTAMKLFRKKRKKMKAARKAADASSKKPSHKSQETVESKTPSPLAIRIASPPAAVGLSLCERRALSPLACDQPHHAGVVSSSCCS